MRNARCPSETAVDPALLAEQWRTHTHVAAEILIEPETALTRAAQTDGSLRVVVVTGSVHWPVLPEVLTSP